MRAVTRRNFLQTAGVVTGGVLGSGFIARPSIARAHAISSFAKASVSQLVIDDIDVQSLALRAVDAAKSAGATYADARLTRTVQQSYVGSRMTYDQEIWAIGVRALVDGYWGFAASPFWEADEATQLANDAVAQARTNARTNLSAVKRVVDLGIIPAANGSWVMPVERDPFTLSMEEKGDFMSGWENVARHLGHGVSTSASMIFNRQERAVATTEGSFFTQTRYLSDASFIVTVQDRASASALGLTPSGKGWELLTDAKLFEQAPQLVDEAIALMAVPMKPVEIGRYDVVFDAASTAELVDKTIGVATELDRALGYEANATGTSYLGPDPLKSLGTYAVGAPSINVKAERTAHGAVATVKWDDEGVLPEPFMLVEQGIVTNFQTTREQAAWLIPWYQRKQMPVHSNGCAAASDALSITMQHSPNLILQPSAQSTKFDDLVAEIKKGYALQGISVQADHQAKSGGSVVNSGLIREIVNGKLGAIITGGGFLFNTSELWKKVSGLGGEKSATWYGKSRTKGQPVQSVSHSVSAVPMRVKDIAIIDITRRA